jgi:MATE family multidrug resistance protein
VSETLPLTHRRVLTVALPVVLSNATVPILGAVDTGVVGQMGLAAPIGAVGIGAIALTAIYWIFGFLRMGTAGFTAQAHGAGRKGEVSALLSRAMIIGLCAGFMIVALQFPLMWLALQTAPASAEVETMARSYMGIRIYGAPAAIGIYALTGWMIGLGRTRSVLIVQLWMNGLNIVLDLWFVLGLEWGVEGVAIATLIAEWSGLLLGLWLCRDALNTPAWKDWPRVFERAQMVRFARVNRDILLRSVMLQGIFMSFVFLGARFGDVTLAANHVLLQFLEITAYAMDGFAIAAETLVGQAMGGVQH